MNNLTLANYIQTSLTNLKQARKKIWMQDFKNVSEVQ